MKNKIITLESIKQFVEGKIGKETQLLHSRDFSGDKENDNFIILLDKDIKVSKLDYSFDDLLFTMRNDKDEDIEKDVHCILWEFELENQDNKKGLFLEGIKNGVLVVDGEVLNEEELKTLEDLEK